MPEESVREAPGADGVLLGAVSVEVDGTTPRPNDDIEGLLWDWMMCGTSLGAPGSATPGDVTPPPRSSGPTGPGVPGLVLSGAPGFSVSPIDWRQVGDNEAFACFAWPEHLTSDSS
jgi:hypothetical protein